MKEKGIQKLLKEPHQLRAVLRSVGRRTCIPIVEEDVYRKVGKVLEGIKASARNCDDVLEKVKTIQHAAEAQRDHKLSLINELRTAYDPEADSVFFYSYRSAEEQEFGWMVLSQSEMKRKVVLGKGRVIPSHEL